MTDTNNPNKTEGYNLRSRSAKENAEEQQPPVQMVAHLAREHGENQTGIDTPSTLSGNGGISKILLLSMGTPSI
jgi:hypothetical protein